MHNFRVTIRGTREILTYSQGIKNVYIIQFIFPFISIRTYILYIFKIILTLYSLLPQDAGVPLFIL